MQYLLDTNWTIDYLRRIERVVRRIEELALEGLGMSVISLAELYEGVFYSRTPEGDERRLRNFLRRIEVVGVDDEICRIFAVERGRLRAAGAMIGDFDIMIGATAIRHGLTLLTNNRRHFERIPSLSIISE